MNRAKRILLMTSIVAIVAGGADASIFRKKTARPVAPTAEAASVSLTAIEADGKRVLLKTSGNPAYTSYSPAPGVFVVDLTATSKTPNLVIPAQLPSGMTSVSAEEAVEMGNHLTRVTFRLAQAGLAPGVAVDEHGLGVTLPESTAPATSEAPATVSQTAEVPAPVAETPMAISEPVVKSETLETTKARLLKKVEVSGTADALEVRLTADGAIDHKAFMLENPVRLVIDLNGVRDGIKRNSVAVPEGPVKRVRVGQFKAGSDPVTRVVLDLARKTEYSIVTDASGMRVSFGGSAPPTATEPPPAVAMATVDVAAPTAGPSVAAPAPAPKKSAKKTADPAASVPVIAENATWKMPEAPRQIIRGPADQAPPTTTTRTRRTTTTTTTTAPASENVFSEPTESRQPQVLSSGNPTTGGRTLSAGQKVFSGEPISLNLKDADLKDVLRTFAQLTGLNIAVDPGVTGSVTVDFVEVPWDQALDLILRQNGLAYVLEGNVMRIGTVERLAAETAAQRRLAEEEKLNVTLQTVSFKLSYARASEIQSLLRDIASPRAKIIVDQRTNQLIISEIPGYLQTMRNLIDSIDIPTRQVVIEARLVEASKIFQQQWGFEWGFNGMLDPALGTGTGLIFPNRVGVTGGPFRFGPGNPVLDLALSDVLGTFNLDLALNAFEFEGLTKVISAPKVMTQDNTAAEIQSGFQIPYQTRVNFTTTITYVDATLRLSVTPQITEAGTVIMEIAVQKNEPVTGFAVEGAAGTPLSTRQARTKLMVRDGGTAVIGGIYKVTDNNSQTRLPFLHQLPVIGHLFKTHNTNTTHDELLIFITPRIVRGV